MTTEALLKNLAAIDAYRDAVTDAKKLLPPLETLGETQLGVILGDAVKGLNKADLPYYSRAIKLLLGHRDRVVQVGGGWIFKQRKNGRIRHRAPDVQKTISVKAT